MELEFLKGNKEKGKKLANKLITMYTTDGGKILLYLYSARIKYFISADIYSNENLQEYKILYERQKRILILILELMKRLLMQELFIY
ncbi:hypothetical protein C1147_13665 [Clostridium botulinum]|nr:hypothetical protein C1147_13665 [Clostridium botulinum]RFM21510.1 hypothetical protein C1146_08960 [Clostridium botulinum]